MKSCGGHEGKKILKKYFKKTAQIQAQTTAATNPRTCGTASWRLMGRGGVGGGGRQTVLLTVLMVNTAAVVWLK